MDGANFQSSPTFTGVGAGSYTITVVSNVAGSCQASSTATINPAAGAPTVTTTTVDPTCAAPTGTVQVTAPLGNEYTYSIDGVNFQSSPTFSGLGAGSYTITVKNSEPGGCGVST